MLLSMNFTSRQARVMDNKGSMPHAAICSRYRTIGLHHGLDVFDCTDFGQVFIRILEQGSMDVGLPSQEPFGGKRQLPLLGERPATSL